MTLANYEYTGNTPAIEFTMNPFTVQPAACAVTYSCALLAGSPRTDICSITDGSTVGTFDPTTGNFQFQSINPSGYPIGIYQFEITGTVGDKSDVIVVDVEFVDTCFGSVLTIDPTTLTSTPYTYTIDATADV